MAELTTEQWLAELAAIERATSAQSGDGMTVREIGGAIGKNVEAVRHLLREAKKQGRLKVSRGIRENVAGQGQSLPLYRIAPAPKERKR